MAPKPPKAGEPKTSAQTPFRTDSKVMRSLEQFATFHGRTKNGEIEVAVQVHLVRSMLAALDYPSFVEEIEAENADFDVEAFRTEQEAHLRELEQVATRRATNLDRIVELLP
jgi:hypothetical protein